MGSLVPAIRTPLTDASLLAAIDTAWPLEMGGAPTHGTVAVFAGQVRLETGLESCWQWNVGNWKKYGSFDWQMLRTTEIVDGVEVHETDAFAAFPDLATGVQAFLHAMSTSHWTDAWHAALIGDPVEYVRGLLVPPKYFTADPKKYTAGVVRFFAYYLALLGGASNPKPPDVSDLGIAFLLPDVDALADTVPPTPRNV